MHDRCVHCVGGREGSEFVDWLDMEAFYAVTLMLLVAAVAITTLTILRRNGLLDRGGR